MDNNLTIKILRDDGEEFIISRNGDWRFLKKKALDGFGEFNNELTFVDNATTDGGIVTAARMTKVDRTIKVAYIHPSMNDVARKMALTFFNAKQTYKVYVTYAERTVWQEAYIYKFSIDSNADLASLMTMTVTFMFENPYWKSYDDFGQDIAEVSPKIGFPFLCSFDVNPSGITGGLYNFANKVYLSNDGDAETFLKAIFRAKGEVTNPKLIIGDEYVRLIDTLHNNDVVVMDFTSSPPRVFKNDVNYIGHCDRTSAFDGMMLEIGDTAVQFDADDGSNLLEVSLYYNKLYCAI